MSVVAVHQRTPEWLAFRQDKITATDFAVIAGETGSVVELWAQKRGLIDPPEFDDATRELMEEGLAIEPYLLNFVARRLGVRGRNIDTVRQSRTILATLLRNNPDLTLPENRERFADWLAKEDTMLKSNPVTCRFDKDIGRRLSELAKRCSQPGLKLTQSDAIRMAIAVGLDALEGKG